jgi:CxxC motif-containing protein (DUF1111 family)
MADDNQKGSVMVQRSSKALIAFIISFLLSLASAQAEVARDPGPRSTGANDQPRPLEGLTSGQTALFNAGAAKFQEREAIKDGLGPTMNLDSCGGCHAQPTLGGTSPAKNPQFIFFNNNLKKTNRLPPFITENGPVREVRFKRNPDGTPNGGVHDIFTITGLAGAEGCILEQPNFSPRRNIIFRIPTPTFGGGLIEQILDQNIIDNQTAGTSHRYGVKGRLNIVNAGHTIAVRTNRNGNDGTIARFGWKAQNKSLLVFAGEAYNVEMGITNELFQTERDETPACQKAPTPNDTTNPDSSGLDVLSDIEKFAAFMRFLAPPVPSTDEPGGAPSINNGKQLFHQVGCTACHAPTLRTGHSTVAALDNKDVNLYSDLAIHDMGTGLADGVSQGQANGREFRSAPLWGLGQRLFFLHDGRTKDLVRAIREHRSPGSEANGVVRQFFRLRVKDQQDLLNFLRSL